MQAISLFSGIGGFELAAQLVFGDRYQTIQFVEINPYAQKVLQTHFPNIPIWSDIRTYHPPRFRKLDFPTIIVGGFPCTNTSAAGNKQGLSGSESKLWWEMYRVIVEAQPDFVIIENPTGIICRGLRAIVGALRLAEYETELEVISASELGAPHRRQRVFIIAYLHNLQLRQRQNFTEWTNHIRTDIERARQISSIAQTKSGSVCVDDGVSGWVDGIGFDVNWGEPPIRSGVQPRTPGRAECVSLYGRSIVPLQAAVALMRVKILSELK